MPTDDDYTEGRAHHPDPAVQALIAECWLGEWESPMTVADLEAAVRLVREVDADNRKD